MKPSYCESGLDEGLLSMSWYVSAMSVSKVGSVITIGQSQAEIPHRPPIRGSLNEFEIVRASHRGSQAWAGCFPVRVGPGPALYSEDSCSGAVSQGGRVSRAGAGAEPSVSSPEPSVEDSAGWAGSLSQHPVTVTH